MDSRKTARSRDRRTESPRKKEEITMKNTKKTIEEKINFLNALKSVIDHCEMEMKWYSETDDDGKIIPPTKENMFNYSHYTAFAEIKAILEEMV